MKEFELVAKIQELKGLKNEIEALENRKAELENALKTEMTERNTDELTAGVFKVTWKEFTVNRFSSSKLKAEQPEIYAKYTEAKKERRFLVK